MTATLPIPNYLITSDCDYNYKMDVSHILDPLNDAQREAVSAPPGPLLILAGAGSGKTRVLTHRVAWLVQAQQVSPLAMLAVTFTNKASHEMRGRIENLLHAPAGGMWMGTFHSLCHRLLRIHYEDAGLPQSFEILDSDDQYRLIRRVLRELDLDEAHWPPRQMQWMINAHKEESRRPHDIPTGNDIQQKTLHNVYLHYEELCQCLGVVDFTELLLRTLELLRRNQPIRENYQQRFKHVLVDEFQDTNAIQYQWLRLLSDTHKNLFAVGDDDQSIYGWRGARVENLLNFEKHYPGARIIRLEQNYRSSGNILNAANAVIAENPKRLGKKLWTEGDAGKPIRVYAAFNEIDEARFVVEDISNWVASGQRRDSVAILYRSNAQSRVFEEELLSAGMPYRVYGGLRFFERAEIKDALAYLRLISNRNSDQALERIINLPTRGIGTKTVDEIRALAKEKKISMWQASNEMIAEKRLTPRASSSLQQFQQLIETMAAATSDSGLAEMTDHVLQHSGLLEHYKNQRGERAQSRVENLEELVSATRNFTTDESEDMEILSRFLAHAALEAGEGQAAEWEDCVQLMTLHSAKGLEFKMVFLCGMEEGLFPHQRSIEDKKQLEEERRLCYVGMTRAMQQLTLCYADVRRLYGREHYTQLSRFVGEIPIEYIEEIRDLKMTSPQFEPAPKTSAKSKSASASASATATTTAKLSDHGFNGLTPGQQVRHKKFGEGTVIELEGHGEHARIEVNFTEAGRKWLVCAYANLESV